MEYKLTPEQAQHIIDIVKPDCNWKHTLAIDWDWAAKIVFKEEIVVTKDQRMKMMLAADTEQKKVLLNYMPEPKTKQELMKEKIDSYFGSMPLGSKAEKGVHQLVSELYQIATE